VPGHYPYGTEVLVPLRALGRIPWRVVPPA
jgi:hypothetical protein